MSVARPLMDKTPFPNRVATSSFGGAGKTPGPQGLKLSKLSLLVPEPEESLTSDVAPLLRPSSTRKSLRGRLSGNFKTPLTKGNYWDVSPGDEAIGAEAQAPGGETVQAEAVEEDDELEYMPPSAVGKLVFVMLLLPKFMNIFKNFPISRRLICRITRHWAQVCLLSDTAR